MKCHKHYSKYSFAIVIFMFLFVLTGFLTGCNTQKNTRPLMEEKIFEGGSAYKTGADAYWALSLRGTWREMGRQYGGLVKDDLQGFYKDISEDVTNRGMDYLAQLENAKGLASTLNPELNELLIGMSETSGLSIDEVLILNAGMLNLSGLALGGEEPRSCSGLAVWGEFTPDSNLIFGRNWDIDRESMKKYMKYLSVVVFNPDSGYSLANVHPLGNVYLETGMNDQGLFIELNNGSLSDPQYIDDRENTVSVLSTALNQCGTIGEAAKYLAGIPADLSYALQVADAENCVSVERPTFGARVREAEQDGVLAAYNNFIPPYPKEWEGKVIDPLAPELDPRYQNLIKLANSEKFFGKLDVNSMKDLMDIEVKNGGAVHRGTVYQVIASPSELTLWIRGLDYAGWQEINLKNLFTKK